MAALLLAWLHHHPNDLKLAIEKATIGLQSVLIDTAGACGGHVLKAPRTSEVSSKIDCRQIVSTDGPGIYG
jgi:pyridoxine kinase